VTHNKGVMNGIDAVALATGQDFRAIEAGAHAYAARDGTYRSLTKWRETRKGDLAGELEIPLAVGIVGGITSAHPTAKLALGILGAKSAKDLATAMAAAGLAQNLAALRALASEGIQKGHMKLHARKGHYS
jgi:hydroxymethylglutaryl-CoA reductase